MPSSQPTERTATADQARRARMLRLAAAGAGAALALGIAIPAALQDGRPGDRPAPMSATGTLAAQSPSAAPSSSSAARPPGTDAAATPADSSSSYRGILQDVSRNPKDYVTTTGKKLPVPRGTTVADKKWLTALARRVENFYTFPTNGYGVRTVWAKDDGDRRIAVAGVYLKGNPLPQGWMTLAGKSGARPNQMRVANQFGYSTDAAKLKQVRRANRSLVAVFSWDAKTVYASGFPLVTTSGAVHTTWHKLTKTGPGLWVADLGKAGRLGWQYKLGEPDGDFPVDSSLGNFFSEAREGKTRPSSLWKTWAFEPWAGRRHVTVQRELTYRGQGDRKDKDRMTAIVRIGGVTTPGGGWLVTGDMIMTGLKGHPVNVAFTKVGDRDGLDLVAVPRSRTGETPFAGLELPAFDVSPDSYVMAWAPKRVKTVRSGPVTAKVVDGMALLDLRAAGQRTAKGTPHQSVLLEGLDADGHVIARARVFEPDIDDVMDDPRPWNTNPHDGYPQTVIAWP